MKSGCKPKPLAKMSSPKWDVFRRLNLAHSGGGAAFFALASLYLLDRRTEGNVCLLVAHIVTVVFAGSKLNF
jgi:hypothetical protein